MSVADVLYWLCFTAVALLAVWLAYRALIGRPSGGPHCPQCGYDMTGTPSLTCPECGHDAKTPKNLHRRRRSGRRAAVVAVLLAIACWYATHVRHRMVERRESRWEALVPTTALIVGVCPDVYDISADRWHEVLHRRWLGDQGMKPVVPFWQVWLRAWMAYRYALTAPLDTPAMHVADQYTGWVTSNSPYNDFAARLHARLIVDHPAHGIRLNAAWNAIGFGDVPPNPRLRAAIWRAIELGRLTIDDVDGTLASFGRDPFQGMTDDQFLREYAFIARYSIDFDAAEVYLLELLDRPSIDRQAALGQFQPGESIGRQYLLAAAQCRLRGEPDPLKLTAELSPDGTTIDLKLANTARHPIVLRREDEHAERNLFGGLTVSQAAQLKVAGVSGVGLFDLPRVEPKLLDSVRPGERIELSARASRLRPDESPRVTLEFSRWTTLFEYTPRLMPWSDIAAPTTQRSRQDSNLRPAD